MPIFINKDKKIQGSVVYKESRTGEVILELFTSNLNQDKARRSEYS